MTELFAIASAAALDSDIPLPLYLKARLLLPLPNVIYGSVLALALCINNLGLFVPAGGLIAPIEAVIPAPSMLYAVSPPVPTHTHGEEPSPALRTIFLLIIGADAAATTDTINSTTIISINENPGCISFFFLIITSLNLYNNIHLLFKYKSIIHHFTLFEQ